jgi:tricorn protease
MVGTARAFLGVLVLGLVGGAAAAQEPIRLARTPDISADGKLVAFSYQGDIWVVETIGGTARQVTSHPAHDLAPAFSPDGQWIAFSSNRHGSYDVYVVGAQGGRPRRLTFDSAVDMVCGWTPDGKNVLFASTRSTGFPPGSQLYTVPLEGGRARRITLAEGKEGVYSPTGDRLAYVRGPGLWYRKGYRGSSNDDIWLASADGSNNRRLTAFPGQDASPMWSPDGKTLFYVSEFHGIPANIVRVPVDPPASASAAPDACRQPQQVTFHKDDGVRRARISGNGQWIVYECGADLWVVSTRDGSQPRKLAIAAYADDKANPEEVRTFTAGATELSLSGDEKLVAFAVHGKLFRMPIGPRAKVTQLTDGPANDHGIAWAPDSSKMVFLSDRGGHEDLYLLEADDPEHPKFTEATRFKVTQLTNTPEEEQGVTFAPDGKRVAFLRAGKLWTMKPDGSEQRAVVSDVNVFDYDWSPDSKWLVYARRDGSFASELYIVPAGGATAADPARNVTRYATFNGDVTWSRDGKHIAFLSERRGEANLYVLPLQKPAAPSFTDKAAAGTVEIDWEDIHLRAHSPVPVMVTTAIISPDGSKVAYRDAREGDLWVANTNGGQITRLTTGHVHPVQIIWSRRKSPFLAGLELLYFLDGAGQIHLTRAGGLSTTAEAKSGTPEGAVLPFKVKLAVRREEVFTEMFDQSWRYLSEHFYDAKFHGLDWNAVRAKYRPLVKHVALKEDLYSLLYLMLGELNASHLGVRGYGAAPDEQTADLGLIFDDNYSGPGLKIKEVLKRGPADRRGVTLFPGDLVLAIDGVEITPTTDLSRVLNGKVGENVLLQVATSPTTPPKERRRFEIQAADRGRVSELMYERWVEHNAARVAELSKGKVGYIHIPSMDEAGLDRFLRSLYSDNFDKDAIVLDVRYNGGGFTHDRVLDYLGGRDHTVFRQRDGGQGMVLRSSDRKWSKPLVLLINNRSYSDAEIFPSAFRTLGLGKLVGQPTAGMVIGTYAVRLVDGSEFRIPRTGVFTAKGVNMENEGVQPDVLVDDTPDQLARGVDAQLDRAVAVLQEDVVAWKKKQPAQPPAPAADVAVKPAGGKAGTPLPPPSPMVNPK